MQEPDRILRPKDVAELTGLSKTTIYRMICAGQFPGFFRLGQKAKGMRLSTVQAWIAEQEQGSLASR